jgi:VWFA-related protein
MKIKIFLILILAVFINGTNLAAQAEPAITIVSPGNEEIWFSTMTISIKFENMPADTLHMLEIYLDGRLIKEIKTPPYTFAHDFGKVPQNSSLKAILRIKNQVISSAEIKSFPLDDVQEVDVTQILVPVVVTDSNGNYISDLDKEDFILLEDNVPQPLNNFSKSGKTEFHVVLLIDISSSMKEKIGEVKAAAKQFLNGLLTKNDKAIVVFFNHEVFEDTDFSNNINELSSSISMGFPFGATALYDAVGYSIKLLKSMPGLNIIILLSDGEDNSSYLDPFTLMKKAERSNAVIYAIGKSNSYNDEYQDILKKLSSASGGILFFLEDPSGIQKIYESIRRDIKAEYILEFSPSKKGTAKRYRQITVKLKNNKRYNIRTIKGFYY